MKTNLPKKSQGIKRYLDKAIRMILDATDNRLAKIILFGSYSRGDWVEDAYKKDGRLETYQSDLDIMLIFKKGKYLGHKDQEIDDRLQNIFEKNLYSEYAAFDMVPGKPPVSLRYESMHSFNKQLRLGRYLFTDIYREGIIIYENGDFEIAEPTFLPWSKIRDMAQFDYDYWFQNGKEFIIDCKNCIVRNSYSKAAFELYQAAENFYNTILLVFEGDKPKTHELVKLRRRCKRYSRDIVRQVFVGDNEEGRQAFNLLCEAYIKARYDRNFKITSGQLCYLIKEVEKLQAITEKICLERLSLDDFPSKK
jgi:HEPN domain-containing protein/predicted nucleotidyltransferase